MQHGGDAFAGGLQYTGHGGADDVASRFRISRVPMGPKAYEARVRIVEYDTDHAWMEVISTLV